MIDAGMSSFTIPQLVEWWNFRAGGIYVNRKYFPERDFGLAELIDPTPRTPGAYTFNAWRFEDYNKGNYKKYTVLSGLENITVNGIGDGAPSRWQYYNKNPDANQQDKSSYNFDNLDLDSYTDLKFDRISKSLVQFPEMVRQEGTRAIESFAAIPNSLVTMNDFYNVNGYTNSVKDIASKKFLQDIRGSKDAGYVSWSGAVPLFLNAFEGGEKCISEENFIYKLYLYNKTKPLNSTKSQVFPAISLATHAIGPDGTNQKGKVDGDSVAITDDAPNKKVGGQLKTSYRAYDGTFSAGSEQIYGIIVSDSIPSVTFSDDMVDWAEGMDIEEHFRDANDQHLCPSSGLAITIDMQNANPFQWSPNYANPKGCRGTNKEKVTVNVFNMSTREFKKGETVLLTDRYSLWFIDPIASGAGDPIPLKKTVGKWQFTYHITNQNFFFRFADPTAEAYNNYNQIENKLKDDPNGTPNIAGLLDESSDWGRELNPKVTSALEAEEALARKYLAARDKDIYEAKYSSKVTDPNLFAEKDAGKAWAGYAQVTSWDYMGTPICGLREAPDGTNNGNALVLTHADKNHKGDELAEFNNNGVLGVGRFTAPFFGCAFPDGYRGESKYITLNQSVKDGDDFTGRGFYVTGHNIDQNQAFFNQSRYGKNLFEGGDLTGLLDPNSDFNNISTNIAPYYFFERLNDAETLNSEPHCNIFSSEENLYHLPADIGVNGSFNAEYGGPILSLNKVQQYLTPPEGSKWNSPNNIHDRFHDFWHDPASFQWLWNIVDSGTKEETFNPDNSTFDIRPANPNKIEFRPLTDAVFAQFDPPQVKIEGKISGSNPPSGNATISIPYPARYLNEQGFNTYGTNEYWGGSVTGVIGKSKWGGNTSLWGRKTKNRLLVNDASFPKLFSSNPDNEASLGVGSPDGLIANKNPQLIPSIITGSDRDNTQIQTIKAISNATDVDFQVDDQGAFSNGGIMPFIYNPYYFSARGILEWSKLNDSAWFQTLDTIYPSPTPDNHYGARPNNKSRGGYGVIGAVCTTEMEAGVQIQTSNFLGKSHSYRSNVFYPSWGSRLDLQYNDPNTTALFVKIYEGWPRNQTVYDTRFFAVHHFNEGNNLKKSGDNYPWNLGYTYGEDITYGERDNENNLIRLDENPNYQFPFNSGTRAVFEIDTQPLLKVEDSYEVLKNSGLPILYDKAITNVDHRIPSIFENAKVNLYINEQELLNPDDFKIDSLFNYESEAKQKRPISIYGEGAYITETDKFGDKTDVIQCNHVIENETVKFLGEYLLDKYGEVEGFNAEDYYTRYSKYTPLLPTSLWNVDPNRRGRLLPWIYRKHDIGLGHKRLGYMYEPEFIKFKDDNGNDLIKPEDTIHDIVESQIRNIIVAESGAGYKIGNIFGVTGGNGSDVQMRVSETGVDGSVQALEWIRDEEIILGNSVSRPLCGYGFLPQDFLSGETSGITQQTTSSLSIIPIGNTNTSFKAYFVAGWTNYEEFIDRKPQIVTEFKEPYRVSAPNNKNGESGSVAWRDNQDVQIIPLGAQPLVLGDGTVFSATPGGQNNIDYVVGTNTASINLNYDTSKSNPNVLRKAHPEFDLFFHFHGDISHQWIESASDQPYAFENLVRMELHPF